MTGTRLGESPLSCSLSSVPSQIFPCDQHEVCHLAYAQGRRPRPAAPHTPDVLGEMRPCTSRPFVFSRARYLWMTEGDHPANGPTGKSPPNPQAWALGGADLQHGFDGSAGQHVRHGVVDRRVRIVSYQLLNRQLASAGEVNQARQKGLHVALALNASTDEAALL